MTMPTTPSQIAQLKQLLAGRPDFAAAIQNKKVSLKRYNSEPTRYELFWPDVGKDMPVSLDDVEMLFSVARVQRAIFEKWKVVIEKMKPKEWHDLIIILNDGAQEIEAPDASPHASVLNILERWIERFGSAIWSATDIYHRPLHKDGYYYFRTDAFETGALFAQGSRYYYYRQAMPEGKLFEVLKNAGAESVTVRFPKRKVPIRVWRIPEDFNKPTEPAQIELLSEDEEGVVSEGEKGDGEDKEANAPEEF